MANADGLKYKSYFHFPTLALLNPQAENVTEKSKANATNKIILDFLIVLIFFHGIFVFLYHFVYFVENVFLGSLFAKF